MGIGKDRLILDTSLLADSDNVGAYLRDSAGNLLTSTLVGSDQALDVNVVQSVLPTGAATEATLATLATEVTAAAILADTTAILADTADIEIATEAIAADIADLKKAEDSAHSSGDYGVMSLAVRSDAGGSLAGTDGDYAPLQLDASGRLRVAADLVSSAEYAEDSAHNSGDVGNFMLAVRNDAGTSLVSADGDYAPLQVNADGALRVEAELAGSVPNTAILVTQTTVTSTAAVILASALSDRKRILIENLGAQAIYLGDDNAVTSSDGFRISAGSVLDVELGPGISIYAITAASTADVRILEIA